MTIIVQCDCGRTLRAPDQMSGKTAHCVCGNNVLLIPAEGTRRFELLEPDLADPEEDAAEAPLMPRSAQPKKSGGQKLFRPSLGRNIERGEPDETSEPEPRPRKKRKKRRVDKTTSVERKRQRDESFLAGLIRSLKFPLRTESVLTISVMASAYGVFTAFAGFLPYGILGFKAMAIMLLGTMLILGYFGFFLLQIFRLASIDEDDLPLTLEFDQELILQDLWIWCGTLWWCGLPFGAYWWITKLLDGQGRTPALILTVLGICLFQFPMALMSTALHLYVLAANPWMVWRALYRVPMEYLATLGVFGTLCGTAVVIGRFLPPIPTTVPVLSHMATWIFVFYTVTSAAYGFGNFYYRNRRKIGWFDERPRQI